MASLAEIKSSDASRRNTEVRLGARNLNKRYGAVQANRNVTVSVAPNEIHAFVGENGAGKSTLMRLLQGIERPDSGHVIVDDRAVEFSGPQQAFAHGIGMVHQEFMLAPDLTLLENLVLGDEPINVSAGPFSGIDWKEALESGNKVAARTAIEIDWSRRAGSTPVHLRQFVEIIRLLRRGARILILDEPTSVLAPQQVEELFDLLRSLRQNATTIVFISHKLNEVMAFADRVTVMRRGEVCISSEIGETDIGEIARHMIGRDQRRSMAGLGHREAIEENKAELALEVRGLTAPAVEKSVALRGVDLAVRQNEIVGVAGVSGNGQHELVECMVGIRPASGGSVRMAGIEITGLENRARRQLGMGYVSSDRRHEGLALDATVEANVIAGSHRRQPIGRGFFLDRKVMRRHAEERLKSLGVRYDALKSPVSSLSGGNQQRLAFSREIAANPSLLVVSQPTRGVDLNGIAAIHRILSDFRDGGGAVLLVSEELDEILKLSDRIYVIADGRIIGERRSKKTNFNEIGRLMLQLEQ